MPYISKEEVAAKRKALKKALPEYKFQVQMKHHSKVIVRILQGPLPLTNEPKGYEDVNHHNIDSQFRDRPKAHKVVRTIHKILTQDQHQEVYDMDYGSVPSFYIAIIIGSPEMVYQVKNRK